MVQATRYLILCALLGFTGALELTGTEEGSCLRDVPYHQDIDPVWMESFRYISAGSKLYLYRHASGLPEFAQMREYEFFYDACYVQNTSFIEGNGSVFGFGQVLSSADTGVVSPGVFTFTLNNPQTGTRMPYTVRVTLTDYRTFVVLTGCVEGSDQKAFSVLSLGPQLGKHTERLIEDHVVSLQFRRENVVFLRYSNCDKSEEFLRGHRIEAGSNLKQARSRGKPLRFPTTTNGPSAVGSTRGSSGKEMMPEATASPCDWIDWC